jgi:predicted 3-demethylubiquinone-9 3-methyltransferase (glyoxalase superfamily)
MYKLQNSDLLKSILKAIYLTASRRTAPSFAIAVIGAITKTLESKYDFLKNIVFHDEGSSDDFIFISSEVNSIEPYIVAKAIESIVQVVYLNLKKKAGFFFIKELIRNAGENVISNLKDIGVDLELIQIQQHYLYRRQNLSGKTKLNMGQKQLNNVSLLGYSWKNVSNWKFDTGNKNCVIYDNNGKELDNINLDTVVRKYISSISDDGRNITDENKEEIKKIELTNKEFELLNMIQSQDTDFESATALLHITQEELKEIIRKLLTSELLHYVSSDEIALTEIGIAYLKERKRTVKIF